MRRVLVIGSGGAGKSTFASRLAEQIGVELIHLDALYWRPGWVETPKADWARIVNALTERESWVWMATTAARSSAGWLRAIRWCSSTFRGSSACREC